MFDGNQANGFMKRSTMGYVIASSGVLAQKGRVRGDLDVDMEAAALLFEEKDNFRPYLQLSGEAVRIHGDFPGNVTELPINGRCRVTYSYKLSDGEIADLAAKGLFHEEFRIPEELETASFTLPAAVEYRYFEAGGETAFVVDVPDAHMLSTDTAKSGVDICSYFAPQASDDYAREAYMGNTYYQHVEAGMDVQPVQDMGYGPAPEIREGDIYSDVTKPVEAEAFRQEAEEPFLPEADQMREDLADSRWLPGKDADPDLKDMGDAVSGQLGDLFGNLLGVSEGKQEQKEAEKPAVEPVKEPEAPAAESLPEAEEPALPDMGAELTDMDTPYVPPVRPDAAPEGMIGPNSGDTDFSL